jgi:CHASE3 domain sensor protein
MKEVWRQRSTALPALLFAVIPITFLVIIAYFRFEIAVPAARQARADAIASFQTLRTIGAVDEAVQDAERGQRGYLLTGRETYLEPYTGATTRVPRLMADLQAALAASGGQQDLLLPLQADLTTKMNEMAATLAAYKS